jgi:hypothetical protein
VLLKLAETHRANFDHLAQDHVMLKTESIFSLVSKFFTTPSFLIYLECGLNISFYKIGSNLQYAES